MNEKDTEAGNNMNLPNFRQPITEEVLLCSCENGTKKAGFNEKFSETLNRLFGKYDETLKGLKDR